MVSLALRLLLVLGRRENIGIVAYGFLWRLRRRVCSEPFRGSMLGGLSRNLSPAPAGLVIVGMAAVFAGAARVPIATLLMVAEMTGGYQLLVPAGLAVMLSFLIQIKLSSFFKYGSLYEAQVAGRADSPAHRAENVRIARATVGPGQGLVTPASQSSSSGSPSSVGCSHWIFPMARS